MNNSKLDSPSFHRNIEPILILLKKLLVQSSINWLEIGSGSGQHVERFAREFPTFNYQPTDVVTENLSSIAAWTEYSQLNNVRKPVFMNLLNDQWPQIGDEPFDIVSAFNVIHISPWDVTDGLFRAAKAHGVHGCRVFLYGPFRINGSHTSESNASFELWLRAKSDAFGIRDIDDVQEAAMRNGYKLVQMHKMPANNFMMEFSNTGE